MKTLKVLIVLLSMLIVFGCASNKGSEKSSGKSKAAGKVAAMYLDDSKINSPQYAMEFGQTVIETLKQVPSYIDQNSFDKIAMLFDDSKKYIAISEEASMVALGLREKAVAARASAAAAGSGNAGSDQADLGASVTAERDALLAKGVQMSDIQKQYFLISLTSLAVAIAQETILVKNATKYPDYVKGLDKMSQVKEAKNLPKAAKMVSELPGTIASQLKTLKTYIDIAKTNNIKIPDDVSKLI